MANSCHTGAIEDLHVHLISPPIHAAKTAAKKEDNPTWWQAMHGPYAKEFWKAAVIEIDTLECIKLGLLFLVQKTSLMSYLPPGLLRSNVTQMGQSKSAKDVSALTAINRSMVLISLKPTVQSFNGLLSG
jgi:hypothetical protein